MTTYAGMTKPQLLDLYNDLARGYTERASSLGSSLSAGQRKQFQSKTESIAAIEALKTRFSPLWTEEESQEAEEAQGADPVDFSSGPDLTPAGEMTDEEFFEATLDEIEQDLRPGWLRQSAEEAAAQRAAEVESDEQAGPEAVTGTLEANDAEAGEPAQEEIEAAPEALQARQRARRSSQSGPKPTSERGIFLSKLDGTRTLAEAALAVGRDKKWASIVVSCLCRDYGMQFEKDAEGRVRVFSGED